MTLQGGQYVFDLMDTYGGGFTVLVIGACEMIGIMWIYGRCPVDDLDDIGRFPIMCYFLCRSEKFL